MIGSYFSEDVSENANFEKKRLFLKNCLFVRIDA